MVDKCYSVCISWLKSDLNGLHESEIQALYSRCNLNESGFYEIEKMVRNLKKKLTVDAKEQKQCVIRNIDI